MKNLWLLVIGAWIGTWIQQYNSSQLKVEVCEYGYKGAILHQKINTETRLKILDDIDGTCGLYK